VNTTSATWLGLTAGCAQCHTHKYDPLTHREYFGLFALLNNADEPTLEIVSPEQQQERVRLRAEIAQLEAELPAQFPAKGPASEQATTPPWQAAFTAWEQQAKGQAAHWQTVTPVSYASSLPLLTLEADQSLVSSGDISKRDTFTLVLPPSTEPIVAVRLEALADPRLPGGGPGRVYYEGPTGDFFLSEIVATAGDKTYPFRSTRHSFASGKFDSKFAIDGDQQSGWAINGRQGDDHRAAFYFETPVPAGTSLKLELLFERYYAAPLGRFRVAVSSDPRAPESSLWPPEVEAALVTPADKRSAEQQNILLRHFCSVAPELAPARKKIDALRNQLRAGKTSLVFQEWPSGQQRPTVRYHRGEYLQPRESVAPGVPAFLPPLPAGATANRLSLAQWLVSRENPLTARVIVNRHWQAFFGRGLVRTLEDFGAQGELPSHSELLDYLAVQFMEQGWSQKKLLRLIVTSATYQQATHGSQQLRERDPQNRLLARGPRVRLDAEQIRDSVLAAAGLLSAKMYGPSVFPPQPASVTSEGTYGKYNWVVSTGEDRYRRSLYTFAKRTAPFAMYTTFDGPPGEFCFVRREISNSPLQGLTLLNDAMFLEAAQALGRTLSAATASDEERISLLFQRSLTREPTAAERETLLAFLAQQRARLASQEIKPEAIAGEGPAEQVAERAAWTLTARIVLNLDEMITKP
jgi:hypothetical protein